MDVPNYSIRKMDRKEIPLVMSLAKEGELYTAAHSLESWYEVDPEGIYVAVTDAGEIIGVCCAFLQHEDLTHFGLYAVKENLRQRGIGTQLWNACLKYTGDRNASVNGLLIKMHLYRDRGKLPVEETEWFILCSEIKYVTPERLLKECKKGVQVRPIMDGDLPIVLEYDYGLAGFRREKLITRSVKEPESTSFLAVQNGHCVGYGSCKPGIKGHLIVAPLYADSQEIAEVILRRLMETVPKVEMVLLSVINANEGAKSLIEKCGKEANIIDTGRAYRKHTVNFDKQKVFSLFDLSFSVF